MKKENRLPHVDECRHLILKVLEQAVRDFIALEHSKAPIEQFHYETAKKFLFEDQYEIRWGKSYKTCTDLLDILNLEVEWFRNKVHKTKKRKEKIRREEYGVKER